MKKVLSLVLVVCMAFSCLALSACVWEGIFGTTTTTTPSGTTAPKHEGEQVTDILKQIVIEDYLIWSGIQSDKKPEEIDCEFFGRYGDSVAVYFHTSGAYETPIEEEIAGYKFSYPDSRVIRIWNAGKFYKMPEAHELGLISDDDVEAISVASQDIEFKEPYFVYLEKRIFTYNEEYDYYLGRIEVLLDPGISYPKKEFDIGFFGNLKIETIEYRYRQYEDNLTEEDIETYKQRLTIVLVDKSLESTLAAVELLSKIDGIYIAELYWEIDYEDIFQFTPNDTLYRNEDNLITDADQWSLNDIGIELVWDFTTGTDKVFVGIIDSGISDHSDLNMNHQTNNSDLFPSNLEFSGIAGDDPVSNPRDLISHGTHIAGIIGAQGNNGIGVSGINWDTFLIQMRVANPFNIFIAMEDAILYASQTMRGHYKIKIINCSIGYSGLPEDIKDAIMEYCNRGGLFVCSAGNEGRDNDIYGNYPSNWCTSIDGIISVGKIDINESLPNNANWGQNSVLIYAPGEHILSTVPHELCDEDADNCDLPGHKSYGYHYMSGSSMAAPHVTGVAALLLSVDSDLTAAQIKECILEGAEEITISIPDGTTQQVKSLNAWGSFKYLMNNYPALEQEVDTNLTQCSYNINSTSTYFYENTAMIKLVVPCDGNYTFSISSNNAIDVILYDSDLEMLSTSQTEYNSGNQIVFSNTLEKGTYYLRAAYSDGTSSGTINVSINCNAHEHNYDRWSYYNSTLHAKACACGNKSTEYAAHAIKLSEVVGNRAPCRLCGAMIILDDGFGQIIHNVQKISINGSYILPNGIIVLVDEDVEAYENGTLVFYDKNNLPEMQ